MLTQAFPQKYVIDFDVDKSIKGDGDCRSQTFSTILKYYGYELDAIDILGLGNGLEFKINKINYSGIELLTIQGRDFEAERRCCECLNIEFIQRVSNCELTDVPFDIEILSEVAQGHPILVNCDVFYMKYLTNIKRSHNKYHMVIIIGFDLEEKTLTVVDSLSDKLQIIDMSQLHKAMFEPGISVFEDGLWYELKINKIKEGVCAIHNIHYINSLKKQSEKMLLKDSYLDDFLRFIQFVSRINKRAKEGYNNYRKYLEALLEVNCLLVRRQDEINGTIYRTIYCNFLKNNYDKFGEENQIVIDDAIDIMHEIERRWRKIAFKARYASGDVTEKCDLVLGVLGDIYNSEKKLAELLSKIK